MTQTQVATDFAAYIDSWNEARQERDEQRRESYGYVSYAGFNKLGNTPQRFPGIPGSWKTGPTGPSVELSDGEELTVGGQVATGSHTFAPLRERELRRAANAGDVVIELSKRGSQDLLRPIDPSFEKRLRENYDHTPAYEPDQPWIIEGEYVPFEELRPTPLPATIGDIVHTRPAVGEVVFQVDGTQYRLLVIGRDDQQARTAGKGFTLFTDATSGSETDPLGRSLEIDFPAERGPVTLDFNFARNLQRPYTRFATCPISPKQNHLDIAVDAGDKLPIFR